MVQCGLEPRLSFCKVSAAVRTCGGRPRSAGGSTHGHRRRTATTKKVELHRQKSSFLAWRQRAARPGGDTRVFIPHASMDGWIH